MQLGLKTIRGRRWLAVAVGLYGALAAAEIARNGRASTYAEGFYDWEFMPTPGDPDALVYYRWAGGEAALGAPVRGSLVTIPMLIARPDLAARPVRVTVRLNGRAVDRLLPTRNGWVYPSYYVPPLTTPPAVDAAELRIDLETDPTFVPAEHGAHRDRRRLGVAVGELVWSELRGSRPTPNAGDALPATGDEILAGGLGLYATESTAAGRRFRWTRQLASVPLEASGRVAVFGVRALNPDIEEKPLLVEVFARGKKALTTRLRGFEWRELSVPLGESEAAGLVLSIWSERTWNPAELGVSYDARDLGVAITEIRRQ